MPDNTTAWRPQRGTQSRMNQIVERIDRVKFGPWAIVTGASSGIGKEFSRQLAANGLNIVLVARRLELLKELGQNLEKEFGVQCRAVQVDLSDENFIGTIKEATQDLDICLVVSNAGTGNPGSFTKKNRDDLLMDVRLSVTAHLELCHHFAPVLVKRGHGGILLVGAMGASHGVPYMANSGAALVLDAFDTLFNKRNYAAAEKYWSPNYIQHSAHIEPGRDGLFNLIKTIPPTLKYESRTIVAEGDFVIVHGRFSGFGAPVNWIAAYIVRIKDGILVEHFDVIQDEATKAQSKSGFPMFGEEFSTERGDS